MMNRRSFLGGLVAAVVAALLPKTRTAEAREASADKGGYRIPDDLLDDAREMLDTGVPRYREVFLPPPDDGDAAETLTRPAREAGVDSGQADADDKAVDALRQALNGMRNTATADPFYQNASIVTFYLL